MAGPRTLMLRILHNEARFAFLLRKVRFSFLEAFGSLRVNSNIELFSFRQVTDVAVFSASRWFIFSDDYQEF